MNKAELVAAVATKSGFTQKDTTAILNAILDEVRSTLKGGDKVQLVNFGSFEVRNRPQRKGRNPKTSKEMIIPASRVPVFKAGKEFKTAVAGK